MDVVRIPMIKVHQEIGDLYVGVMKAEDVYLIAEVDRIRLDSLKIPKYAGFQRALVKERVDAIRDYLNTPRSTFPNAIIVSLDSDYVNKWEDVEGNPGVSILELRREKGAVTIIDGQHRAAALDKAQEGFQVIVSLFIDLEMMQCAEIFAKINSTQKAVNPSIAFQLFGYAADRSPQRTAHEIAEILNSNSGSPFYKRLRMLGTKDAWVVGTLSQSTFCKELMRLYTRDPVRDENALLRGEKPGVYSGYPLRSYFLERDDKRILEIVWRFFYHVAKTWRDQWNDEKSILTKTTGFAGFMSVLRLWLLSSRGEQVLKDKGVAETFERIKGLYTSPDRRFLRSNYPAGNQGVVELRDSLVANLKLE